MKTWWDNLSSRERRLLIALTALIAIAGAYQLVFRPFADWSQSARGQAERARNAYDVVAAAASQARARSPASDYQNLALRQAVTQSADDANISLLRIGAEANGEIEVQVDTVSGEALFAWLNTLNSDFGVEVIFADISRADGGAVNAQVLVLGRG